MADREEIESTEDELNIFKLEIIRLGEIKLNSAFLQPS